MDLSTAVMNEYERKVVPFLESIEVKGLVNLVLNRDEEHLGQLVYSNGIAPEIIRVFGPRSLYIPDVSVSEISDEISQERLAIHMRSQIREYAEVLRANAFHLFDLKGISDVLTNYLKYSALFLEINH